MATAVVQVQIAAVKWRQTYGAFHWNRAGIAHREPDVFQGYRASFICCSLVQNHVPCHHSPKLRQPVFEVSMEAQSLPVHCTMIPQVWSA